MIQVPEDFFRLLAGVIGIDTLFLQFDIDEYRPSPPWLFKGFTIELISNISVHHSRNVIDLLIVAFL